MPRCGRPARRAVSRPVCAHEKNQALSVDRKLLGTSKRASHPARPVPAFAAHGPRCSADACRSAIGRPILYPFRVRSSMDRASVFGTEGCRFESCRAYFFILPAVEPFRRLPGTPSSPASVCGRLDDQSSSFLAAMFLAAMLLAAMRKPNCRFALSTSPRAR
jgi:hypothetical protein